MSRVVPTRVKSECRREIGLQDGEIAVGFVGRFSFEKNPVAIAAAVAKLGKPYRAVFVGSGWQEQQLRAEVSWHLSDAIFVDTRIEIADIWNALDCLVLASPSEGMSLSLLEAWGARVPVVATRVGAVDELCKKHGYLCMEVAIHPTREDVAEKILWAVDPCNKPMIDRAHKLVSEQLTAVNMTQAYEDIILGLHRDPALPKRLREADTRVTVKDRPIRVGFVSPSLTYPGGAERCILSLLRMQEDPRISISGVSVLGPDRHWGCVDEAQKYGSVMFGYYSAGLLGRESDVIISWGIDDLDTYLPDYRGKLIVVAHGCSEATRGILKNAGRRADACVGVSRLAVDMFPKGCNSLVIYNGYEVDRVTPTMTKDEARLCVGLTNEQIAVGYLGRYAQEKNPLAAARIARELGDPYVAVYVGAGDMEDAIRSTCDNLIMLPAVQNVGNVLAALDCLVAVSPAEGGGIVFAEAWAAGVPLIATPVGIVPELTKIFKFPVALVPINPSDSDLVQAVHRSQSFTSANLEMGKTLAAQHLTVEKMIAEYAELIVQLISG